VTHEIARLRLEQAGTFRERTEAVEAALLVGMPRWQIEQYLDLADAAEPRRKPAKAVGGPIFAPAAKAFTCMPAR